MATIDTKKTNKLNLVFQSLYAVMLAGFVIGSFMIKKASAGYLVGFLTIAIVGFTLIFIIYFKNGYSENLKYLFAGVHTLLYLYIMILGHAEFRFAFILPILFYLVLYRSVWFIIFISLLAIAVNILNVFICIFVLNKVTYDDSTRYVIQLMAIICSMFAASVTTEFYRRAYNRNLAAAAELEQMNLSTIETIANTIDAKDAYTQGHSRRVAEYSALIAKRMGFSEEEISDIHYIALLHDVGKIAVPDSVLNKPTRLTNEEFNLMKTHTTAGGEILKDIKNIKGLVHGAKYHHERYDGKGYPEGLKGEEIPLIARIISLADAYDAMTSNRVYRKPLPYEIVISEIKTGRGTQFAPEVVDAFLECLKDSEIMPHTHDYMAEDSEAGVNKAEDTHTLKVDSDIELLDELTGAYQEKYGVGMISQKLLNSKGCLIMFNIVGLRQINYELGFMVGDYYIKMVAETILGSRFSPITVRFNGNQFLCFLENAGKEEASVFIKDCINRVAALEENDIHMEKSLDLTCAAKVVEQSNHTINEHIENLEKILYLLKGKEGEYAFFDTDADKKHVYNISKDMEILINAIKNSEMDTLSKAMGNKNIEDVIRIVKEHPDEEVGVALFTIKPMDEEHLISVNLEYATKILEEGMKYVVKNREEVFYYSSLQRMVILYGSYLQNNSWEDYFDSVEKDVMSFFHKNYDKIDVEIGFSASVIN